MWSSFLFIWNPGVCIKEQKFALAFINTSNHFLMHKQPWVAWVQARRYLGPSFLGRLFIYLSLIKDECLFQTPLVYAECKLVDPDWAAKLCHLLALKICKETLFFFVCFPLTFTFTSANKEFPKNILCVER